MVVRKQWDFDDSQRKAANWGIRVSVQFSTSCTLIAFVGVCLVTIWGLELVKLDDQTE